MNTLYNEALAGSTSSSSSPTTVGVSSNSFWDLQGGGHDAVKQRCSFFCTETVYRSISARESVSLNRYCVWTLMVYITNRQLITDDMQQQFDLHWSGPALSLLPDSHPSCWSLCRLCHTFLYRWSPLYPSYLTGLPGSPCQSCWTCKDTVHTVTS